MGALVGGLDEGAGFVLDLTRGGDVAVYFADVGADESVAFSDLREDVLEERAMAMMGGVAYLGLGIWRGEESSDGLHDWGSLWLEEWCWRSGTE